MPPPCTGRAAVASDLRRQTSANQLKRGTTSNARPNTKTTGAKAMSNGNTKQLPKGLGEFLMKILII
jgi:hypothetical protein